ncbi:transglycosylase SLT domain-containing protein [Candidatus Uhrbacteria bacterium]|nr:transglycosylase SLT domain-containing protein [Candidatus Uhrbacteria bacterium]MBD3284164.1 transglycosylase SLT domain-containing protein [Candidatus Uhrbacteria bacterium]
MPAKQRATSKRTLRQQSSWIQRFLAPLRSPLVQKHRRGGHRMILRERQFAAVRIHPYIRTMFLSLLAGTISVGISALHFVQVDAAMQPQLEAASVPMRDAASMIDTPFVVPLEGTDRAVIKVPPKEYLKIRTEELGYDHALLYRIASCESGWRMVKNRRSTAYGYFQIIDGTERMTPQYKSGRRKTDPYTNIEMALYLYGKQGTIPWLASRHCWSR